MVQIRPLDSERIDERIEIASPKALNVHEMEPSCVDHPVPRPNSESPFESPDRVTKASDRGMRWDTLISGPSSF